MKARLMLLGLLCSACPPPAMNPTPDPLPTAVTTGPAPPGAGGTTATLANSKDAASKPAKDAAPPPLSTPNSLASKDAGTEAASAPSKFTSDEAALHSIGERAQQCAAEKRIALPPNKPLWVRMMLSVETDGTVSELRLSGTSGLADLDLCATAAAKAVQFPPRDAAIWLEAPIGFQAQSPD